MKIKTKLLLVEPVSDLGGVSQYIISMVRYLPKDLYEIHVAASGKGHLFHTLKQNDIITHSLKIDYSLFSAPSALICLRKFLKKEKYDIIHAHTTKIGFLCGLAKIGIDVKTVYTGHCLRYTQKKNYFIKLLFLNFERIICKSSSFITVVSKKDYDLGISAGLLNIQNTKIVPMSIDIGKYQNIHPEITKQQRVKFRIPANAFVVGMIGRLTNPRDPETFIKTAAVINTRIKDSYFLWVGDGDLKEKIIQDATHFGIFEKIIITGWQDSDDIPKLLSALDVVLNATKIESMGIALLEAMAAKKPVVSSNVGGVPNIIKDGVTGWLFNAGDYKKAADIIENIYLKRFDVERVRETAFKMILNEYSPKEKMAGQYHEIYNRIINNTA